MRTPSLIWSLNLGILLNLVIYQGAKAQVTPDNTVNTQVNQNGKVAEITGGQTEGSNLFHSFQEFSVGTGNEAFFNNADTISNIFSRVTGGNVSTIDGLISANDANLFLINPAGIMFGGGAKLDLGGGSFYGSTADSILFPDNVDFSASDSQAQPILTINAPIGLGFRDNPQGIEFTGATLEVESGEDLGFVGGNISLDGSSLIAPGGRVQLGSLSVAGEVGLSDDVSFSFPEGIERADISLINDAEVDVRAEGGGFINVNARNLTLSKQSEILAGISEDSNSPEAQAGDITINATETVKLIGEEFAFELGVFNTPEEARARETATAIGNNIGLPAIRRENPKTKSNAQGNGGSIFIDAKTLELSNVASVGTTIYGKGNGGDIVINADLVSLDGGILGTAVRGLNSDDLTEQGEGDAGDILINTNSLSITNDNGLIFTGLQEGTTGDGGDIIINAADNISISSGEIRNALLLTQVGENATGNAGDINITTSSLELDDRGLLISDIQTGAIGNAGNISIDAQENVSLAGNSQILAQVKENAVGNAGDISITAGNLNLQGGSQVLTDTSGSGDAGNVKINVRDQFILNEGSLILANVESNAIGNAGDIEITSGSLEITGASFIIANTNGKGNAGNLKFNVQDQFILSEGSFILAQVLADGGQGNAGNIEITSGSLEINQAFVLADTLGQGNAGNIKVNTGSVFLNGGTTVSSETQGIGNAGKVMIDATDTISLDNSFVSSEVKENAEGNSGGIELSTGNLSIINSAGLTATTAGKGNSGLIKIQATGEIVLDNSFINSLVNVNAIGDSDGIEINANNLSLINGSKINSFTLGKGNAGGININSNTISLTDNAILNSNTNGDGSAGNIIINASESIVADESSLILAQVQENGLNNAGDIEISTNSLEFTGKSLILATTKGKGNAGNIKINVQEEFVLNEEGIVAAQVENGAKGNSGDIDIKTGSLELEDKAFILADTKSQGNAGDITIETNDSISLSKGSIISTDISEEGEGTAGDVNISAAEIFLDDRSIIASSTAGQGDGGSTNITSDFLSLENFSLIAASTRGEAIGTGGEITINSDTIQVSDGGIITSFTNTDFDGGEITINAQTLDLNSGGNIFTGTESTGNAGNISLNISDRIILDGNNAPLRPSNIEPFDDQIINDLEGRTGILADATNESTGNGGNININTNFIIAFPNGNSDIVANAFSGRGGNITINAESLLGIQERTPSNLTNDIDASSQFSLDGNVTINTPDINPLQGVTELSSNVVEPEQTTAQACQSDRQTATKNGLTVKGKGGIPPTPDLPLSSQNITINGEPAAISPNSQYQPISTSYGDIMPARGAIKTEDGQVILTSYRPSNSGDRPNDITPQRIPQNSINCS